MTDPGSGNARSGATEVLGPNVSGTWYPAEREALEREIDAFLSRCEPGGSASVDSGRTAALIAPHAGYRYSGPVAAHGFRLVRGARYDRVILVGPSHYAAFPGAAAPRASFYRTPLGDTPIDREAISRLEGRPGIRLDDRPFAREHSLEMEIPFLERSLAAGWRLLPVLMGAGSADPSIAQVAEALRPLLGPETLLVVSSDFTHYGPRFEYVPFDRDVPRRIEALDRGAIDRILERDARGFRDYVARTGATICGRGAIDLMLHLLPEHCRGEIAAYDTSGRITGSWDHSVSYASLVFHDSPET